MCVCVLLGGCQDKEYPQTLKTDHAPVQSNLKSMQKQPLTKPSRQQEKQKIALLLPLSGPYADLGQDLQKAAEMSFFHQIERQQPTLEDPNEGFELLIEDTQGTAEGAKQAARHVLAQGAKVILGPVFAYEVRSVLGEARSRHVPVLSFSSDKTVAGRDSYIFGFSPEEQIHAVLDFAYSRGLEKMAILSPATDYGRLVHEAAQKWSQVQGRPFVVSLIYQGQGENLETEITALKEKRIDAVLLSVGGQDLTRLADNLQAWGLDLSKVQLLGTGLWDNPEMQALSVLSGAWYASSDPSMRVSFEAEFIKNYGKAPKRIATLAYDSLTFVVHVLASQRKGKEKKRGNSSLFEALKSFENKPFSGVEGVYSLTSDGKTRRNLSILSIGSNQARVVS